MAKAEIPAELELGKLVEVTPERVAHGGALVARVHNRVIFVRHGVIGETATARITAVGTKNRFFFADVVSVSNPSAQRRQHPWKPADSLVESQPLGGMEYGHLDSATQRDYKTAVVREQLIRLGGLAEDSAVLASLNTAEIPGGELGTRTRVHFGVDQFGQIGMYPHQSATVQAVQNFPLATEAINQLSLDSLTLVGITRVDVVESSMKQIQIIFTVAFGQTPHEVAPGIIRQCQELWGDLNSRDISLLFTAEKRGGRRRGGRPDDLVIGSRSVRESIELDGVRICYEVSAGGFWQNHRYAPITLARAIAELADFEPGESVYDLYAGAGLFTAVAAHGVGPAGFVLSVEGSPLTSSDAHRNFAENGVGRTHNSAQTVIEVRRGDVSQVLKEISDEDAAVKVPAPTTVILDPSRVGAGRVVVQQIAELRPKKIIYVACDPAALGRDTGYFRELGWELDTVQAFDLYPNTHHVEAVAVFTHR